MATIESFVVEIIQKILLYHVIILILSPGGVNQWKMEFVIFIFKFLGHLYQVFSPEILCKLYYTKFIMKFL